MVKAVLRIGGVQVPIQINRRHVKYLTVGLLRQMTYDSTRGRVRRWLEERKKMRYLKKLARRRARVKK